MAEVTREKICEVTGFISKNLEEKIIKLFEVKAYPIIRRFIRYLRSQGDIGYIYGCEFPLKPPPVKPPTEQICKVLDFTLDDINARAIEAVKAKDWTAVETMLRILRSQGDLRFVYACPLSPSPSGSSSSESSSCPFTEEELRHLKSIFSEMANLCKGKK